MNKSVFKEISEEETEGFLYFYCDQCDFKSASEKGLRHHVRMKHNMSQLDGVDDTELKKLKSEINKSRISALSVKMMGFPVLENVKILVKHVRNLEA